MNFSMYNLTNVSLTYVDFIFFIPELFIIVSALGVFFYCFYVKYVKGVEYSQQQLFSLSNVFGLYIVLMAFALFLNSYPIFFSRYLLFNDLVYCNFFILCFKILLCFFSIVYFLIANSYVDRDFSYEYTLFVLISIFSMFGIISSSNLIVLYIFLELQSFCLYIMVGFRKTSAFSIEAALKFFILGSLASVLFLFGSGMVYLAYGTFNLRDMTVFATYTLFKRSYALFAFGFSFILASFCFKLGLFPFHTWLPDVYDGAPMIVTFFLSVVSKIPLILVFLFFHHIFLTPFSFYFSSIFCFLSIFTIFFGSIGALFQVRLKRFLAYSSISQLGFIVLSLSYDYCMPLETFLLYTFVYLLLNLTLFICLMIFYIDFRTTKFTTSFSTIYDLSVCYDRNPFVSIIMVLSLFSLAGIPPLAGFVSKYYLIYTIIVLSNEMSLVWPMLVIMFVNTISVFYYVRLAGIILFGTANNDIVAQKGGEDVKVVSKPDKSNPEFQISYMLAFTLVFLFYFNVFFICSEKYIYFFIKLLFSLF